MVRRRAVRGVRRGGTGCLGWFPFMVVVGAAFAWYASVRRETNGR